MLKFTQLTSCISYPPKHKARLSTMHADIITAAISQFQNTLKFKNMVVHALNIATYMVLSGDSIPDSWNMKTPFENIPAVDDNTVCARNGDLHLASKNIIWDVEEVSDSTSTLNVSEFPIHRQKAEIKSSNKSHDTLVPTPKEHLYLRPPTYPQFDVSKPWIQTTVNNQAFVLYTTLPLIPTNQSEISVTTDISIMSKLDLLKLFPNRCIQTRHAMMYDMSTIPKTDLHKFEFDENLGVIFPISGFSLDDVRDNIIRYPHIYKLLRFVDGKYSSFYQQIEINGMLHNTIDVWDTLDNIQCIPRTSEYIKEYVVRRYLLERDKLHLDHSKPLYGTLDPFLTMFMPSDKYADYGYNNPVQLAMACVKSRVAYKQSRNPIIRAVNHAR